ncbi:MAG: VPLPA-CTERM sorting domain-containing protein [Gammaproteobacteria bacterium]
MRISKIKNRQGTRRQLRSGLALAALVVAAGQAQAAFENPATASWGGWTRGDAGTIYHEWAVFSDEGPAGGVIVDTTPEVGSIGPAPHSHTENSGNAFLTGGGNIYSFSAATDFTVDIGGTAAAGQPTRVALQIRTLGTELDYDTVTLNGAAWDSKVELGRVALGGMGGADVETLFLWTLTDSLASYVFDFNSSESSMSLDALSVDVAPVPLPGALVLMLSGISGFAAVARRRAQSGAAAVAA